MQIIMPENTEFVIKTLHGAGFRAYIVGGCVRDLLLGAVPADYDVCTDAKPEDITRIFAKTVSTGIKHGTVTVINGKTATEVTTFRTDGDYKDFRRPENVEFVSDLKADLSRRDFTVNAMCYNETEGLIDCFGGKSDLEARLLRAVGDPKLRFQEDALRILRLFRFCSTLGFSPEKQTFDAAIKNARLLENISAQRIEKELRRAACGVAPQSLIPLINTGVLPTLRADGRIERIPCLPQNDDLRFFAFLYLTSDDIGAVLDYLKCSNGFKKYAQNLARTAKWQTGSRADIKRLLGALENSIFDLLYFKAEILSEDTAEAIIEAKEIAERGEPYKISQLAIDGGDVAAAGYGGKEISNKLRYLLEKVIANPKLNNRDTLLKLI